MKTAGIWVSALAFFGSVAWFLYRPGFDSGISALVTLAALIFSCISVTGNKEPSQSQKTSGRSRAIQAGRDVNIKGK